MNAVISYSNMDRRRPELDALYRHLSGERFSAGPKSEDRLVPEQFFSILEAVFGPILGQGKDFDGIFDGCRSSAWVLVEGIEHTAKTLGVSPALRLPISTRDIVGLMGPVLERAPEISAVEMRRSVTSFFRTGPKVLLELRKRGALDEFVASELGLKCLRALLVAHWSLGGIAYVLQSERDGTRKTFTLDDCGTLTALFKAGARDAHTIVRTKLAELEEASGENVIEWDPDATNPWPNPEDRTQAISESFDRFASSV